MISDKTSLLSFTIIDGIFFSDIDFLNYCKYFDPWTDEMSIEDPIELSPEKSGLSPNI